MRAYKSFFFVLLLLAGCAQGGMFSPVGSIPVDQSLSPQAQQAQKAINEANLVIGSVAQTITQDLDNKVMGSAEAQKYSDSLHAARRAVQDAKALLTSDPLSAQSKAQLANNLALALQRELAAYAAKGGK